LVKHAAAAKLYAFNAVLEIKPCADRSGRARMGKLHHLHKLTPEDERAIVRYLLGSASAAEEEALDLRLCSSPGLSLWFDIVEDELVSASDNLKDLQWDFVKLCSCTPSLLDVPLPPISFHKKINTSLLRL
jgi:hypothetical protein